MTIDEVLAAVNAANVTPAEITATLRIGKLTTQAAAIDARMQEARLGQQAASQAAEVAVQALGEQKAQIESQLRALLTTGN